MPDQLQETEGARLPDAMTRRRLVGGALVGGAAGALASPLLAGSASASAATAKPCTPAPLGIPTGAIAVAPGGRTVWTTQTHATTITSYRTRDLKRGRSIDVGGAPTGIAISPDGHLALVTTAFYDRPSLALVDLRTGQVDHVDVGPEPSAVAFARDGRNAYVTGTGIHGGTLTRVELRSGRAFTPIHLGAHPRGLVLHPDGKRAIVCLNGSSQIVVVALARRKIVRHIKTAGFPAHLAISRDGTRALATHNGFRARAVTPIDLVRGRAGRQIKVGFDPAGVAFRASGMLAVVTAAGSGTVTLLDARTGRRRRVVKPGGAPRGVAIAGSRAIVADGRSGKLTAVRLGALR